MENDDILIDDDAAVALLRLWREIEERNGAHIDAQETEAPTAA